jgi:hypothetical protein
LYDYFIPTVDFLAAEARPMQQPAYRIILNRTLRLSVRIWEKARAPKDKARDFWRDFWSILFVLFLLWIIDPLEAASRAEAASARLFYRVVAPLYHADSDDPESNSPFDDTTKIAVIVIDDVTLQALEISKDGSNVRPKKDGKGKQDEGEKTNGKDAKDDYTDVTWPPAFSVHALILERILGSSTPKAVFVDFGFFDERKGEGLEKLVKTLKDYALPSEEFVYFAEGGSDATSSSASNDSRDKTNKPPVFLVGADSSIRQAAPSLNVIKDLRDAATALVATGYIRDQPDSPNLYPLFDCDGAIPSPALALHTVEAGDKWKDIDGLPCEAGNKPPMQSVYWATWGDTANSRGSFPCGTLRETALGRLWAIFERWFLTSAQLIDEDEAEKEFQSCPPHRAVSAHDFLAEESGWMSAFLDDRYVFYAGDFVMTGDLVRPPTHELVPGVFLHAMVLDNLIHEELRYGDSSWSSDLGLLLTLVAMVIAAGMSAVAWQVIHRLSKPRKNPEAARVHKEYVDAHPLAVRIWIWMAPAGGVLIQVGWVALFLFISFVCISAVLWVGFFVLMVPPINYIGILSFVGLHSIARTGFEIIDAVI